MTEESAIERLHRQNGGPPASSPELDRLAAEAVAYQATLKPMTPEEVKAWAERLASDVADLTD